MDKKILPVLLIISLALASLGAATFRLVRLKLDVKLNVVLIVLACELTPANSGEAPSLVKYGGRATKKGR